MQLNGYNLVDRSNRPNGNSRLGLRAFFYNDGNYVDPYEVSSVSIFKREANQSPSSVLNSNGLISSDVTPLFHFEASGQTLTNHANFAATNYEPNTSMSGIYKNSTGDYVAVLDNNVALSSVFARDAAPTSPGDLLGGLQMEAAAVSAVGEYIDVWTVKNVQTSNYQTVIHTFRLYADTFLSLTDPLLFTAKNKLQNKHVRLGEKIDLKVATEVGVSNKNIDDSIVNIFKDSLIPSAAFEVRKVNQDPNFAGPFTVEGFGETSSTVTVTSDDTLLFTWDTNSLASKAAFTGGTFGALTGTYSVQVLYTLMNQKIKSPLFYLTVS
mgnify:CR=1 FL=1